jgi:hypothetical protein
VTSLKSYQLLYTDRDSGAVGLKLRPSLALLFMMLMIVSCGPSADMSELDLSGGTAAQTAVDSVVRISSQGQSFCSGVLVASDLVVTAAHCVTSENNDDLSVTFPLSSSDQTRSVAEFQKLRSDSLLFFPNFDIAWLRLNTNAPAPYKPAAVLGNSADVAVGSAMTLVGVANETPCNPGDSNCRLVQLAIRLKSSWSSAHLVNLAVVDSSSQGSNIGTCPGDSGGPSFIDRNGTPVIYGIVAGKDPIFTGSVASSCGSPTTVLTRIGEYQAWIESTSNRKLTIIEPAKKMLSLDFLTGNSSDNTQQASWQDWFNKPQARQSAWTTVHKILEQVVLEFQGQIRDDEIPQLFQSGGQSWVEKLSTLKSLSLGFPDQTVAIEDLRPLEGLKNLSDLTFLARHYKGISTISLMNKLKSLSIIGRVVTRPEQGTLLWKELASPSVETIKLSQLAASQTQELNWSSFPKLKTLVFSSPTGKVPVSWIREEKLVSLQNLQLQELSCDLGQWPKQSMPGLMSLALRSAVSLGQGELSCINWSLLPNLTELSIQGYRLNLDEFTVGMPSALAEQLRSASH